MTTAFDNPNAPFVRHFVNLLLLLLFVGLFTSADDVLQLFSGHFLANAQVAFGLRWLREFTFAVLLGDFLLWILIARDVPLLSRSVTLAAFGILLWASVCVCYSLMLNIPLLAILSGLRFLEYLPLGLMAAVVWRGAGMAPFLTIGKGVFWFLVVETSIAALETRLPVAFWGTTFIGARAFGTFTSPNIFGATMVFCLIFVRVALPSRWALVAVLMSLFDVFASGSRAAVLGFFLLFGVPLLFRLRNPWYRLTIVFGALLAGPLFLRLVSNSEITGRDTGVGNRGYERLDVWSHVLTKLDSVTHLILGWGTGLGSNTVFSIYNYDLPGSYISDNTIFFVVGSYGILGVLMFVGVLAAVAWRLRSDAEGLAAVAIFTMLLLVSQALEVYPVNVLAIVLIGWRLSMAWQKRPDLEFGLAPTRLPSTI